MDIGFCTTDKEHTVEFDLAGFFQGRPTCHSCTDPCQGDSTLIHQPYMGNEAWKRKVADFENIHGKLDLPTYRAA